MAETDKAEEFQRFSLQRALIAPTSGTERKNKPDADSFKTGEVTHEMHFEGASINNPLIGETMEIARFGRTETLTLAQVLDRFRTSIEKQIEFTPDERERLQYVRERLEFALEENESISEVDRDYLRRIIEMVSQWQTGEYKKQLEASTEQDKLKALNEILERMVPRIEPINLERGVEKEKKRVSNAVYLWLSRKMTGRFKEIVSGVVPIKKSNFWSEITTPSGVESKPSLNLGEVYNSLPDTLNIKGTDTPFMSGLKERIGGLVDVAEKLSDRAAVFASYGSPQEFLKKLEDVNNEIPFGKGDLRLLVTGERGVPDSVLEAFRRAKQLFITLAEDPGLSIQYNMYPFAKRQEVEVSKLASTVPFEKNKEWVISELSSQGFSRDSAELAYFMAVADNRSTGMEEFLDYRVDGGKIKVGAIRSMTRIFRFRSWARYSVGEKGSLRESISLTMADKRPALAVTAEKLWAVYIRQPDGSLEPTQLYEVYEKGLWDKVEDVDNAFPSDPMLMFGQHIKYMAIKPYEVGADMKEKANRILPEIGKTVIANILPNVLVNWDVAKILLNYGMSSDMPTNDRKKLLTMLRSGELFTVRIDEQVDATTSNSFKDAGDYSWMNTPLLPKIYLELFALPDASSPTGLRPHPEIMDAVSMGGTKGQAKFVMWNMMSIMAMAELERYAIPHEELHHLDLSRPVESLSKRHALSWEKRMGLIQYLLSLQAGFPPEYREHAFREKAIRIMFEKLNIEGDGNDAVDTADLQFIISSKLGESMLVKPSTLIPNWLNKLISWIPLGGKDVR